MVSIFKIKITLWIQVLILIIAILASSFITREVVTSKLEKKQLNEPAEENCNYRIRRLEGLGLVKPILFIESDCESENLQMLKSDISNIIATRTADGTISSASVYLRKFNTGEFIGVNKNDTYSPGSLLKVPVMIAFLKMSESRPGFLDRKLLCDKEYNGNRTAVNVSDKIQPGKSYSIRELLGYMISNSDNNAAFLLMQNIDIRVFKKVFSDFGMQEPESSATSYPLTASEYSKFLRSLLNGSYLNKENSELAIEMLTRSDYREGILKGIPSDIKVAHKFGEEGNLNNQQLHESAIVYSARSPYLITIMTRGKDLGKQAKVLAEISEKVYTSISDR